MGDNVSPDFQISVKSKVFVHIRENKSAKVEQIRVTTHEEQNWKCGVIIFADGRIFPETRQIRCFAKFVMS